MVIPALILATGVALPLHTAGPLAEGHWSRAHAGYPVESGRPRPSAHQRRPRALHKSLRQAKDSEWYVLTVPQLERPSARLEPRRLPVLRPGLLLHATGQSTGNWISTYVPGGRSWIYRANVRPAAAPRGWLKIHLAQQRRVLPQPRVSPPPVPPVAAGAVASSPATVPAATPAAVAPVVTAVPQVVQVVQVAQPNASIPDQIVAAGDAAWGPGQGQALLWIVERESSANPYAVNTSSYACGLFQRLPCDVQLGDVQGQIADGVAYVTARYGNAYNAQAFWAAHNWY